MLPQTVSTCVSQDAIGKVTRLFNNTIDDVLAELFQNARRAGASRVTLETRIEDDVLWLGLTDNGSGIADPSVLLSLGQSDWDKSLKAREDPAGMGVFSLAGRRAEITSRAKGNGEGWRIAIAADDWESAAPIAVTEAAHPVGTTIRFVLDPLWRDRLEPAARNAALYAPIEVSLNGAKQPNKQWLAEAEAIVERDGVRIGIYRRSRMFNPAASINFHGVTVACRLPGVSEPDRHWTALIDIVDAPQIQLVLPARKEVVDNAALASLRTAVAVAIYEHIRGLGTHRLSYRDWCNARDLGVDLPEATPHLNPWTPTQADSDSDLSHGRPPLTGEPILMCEFGAALEQCAAFVLAKEERFAGRLANLDPPMQGYGWYNALPRVTGMHFAFELNGAISTFDAGDDVPEIESGPVDGLTLFVEVSAATTETFTVPAPVAIIFDDGWHCCLEDARIVFASPKLISANELVDLLEGTCFSPSTERDADSWETQHDHFIADAREIATSLLEGEDAALIEKARNILEERVRWFIPKGRTLHAEIGHDGLELRLDPASPATGAEVIEEKP